MQLFFNFRIFFVAMIATGNLIGLTNQEAEKAFYQGISDAKYYETPQGHQLRYAHFKSPIQGVRNSIVFQQGRGTFLEFYSIIIIPLLEKGFDVWMYDLSGQGCSTRLLSIEHHDEETVKCMQHIDSFDLYLQDMTAFVNNVVLPQTNGGLILGGYSTGAHLALRYLQTEENHPFQSAFLISPLLLLKMPLYNRLSNNLLWFVSYFFDLKKYCIGAGHIDPIFLTSFEVNGYTSDERGYKEMKELCKQYPAHVMGGISWGWLRAATESIRHLWTKNSINKISIPVMLMTGEKDTIVDIRFNTNFSKRLKQCTHIIFSEGRHELFRETPEIKEVFWKELTAFLSPPFPLSEEYSRLNDQI